MRRRERLPRLRRAVRGLGGARVVPRHHARGLPRHGRGERGWSRRCPSCWRSPRSAPRSTPAPPRTRTRAARHDQALILQDLSAVTPIDDGHAVHYTAVERGTPVYGSDEQLVGKVVEVLDNYREHIMDGVVFETPDRVRRFVDAPEVAAHGGARRDAHHPGRRGGAAGAAASGRAEARRRRAEAPVRPRRALAPRAVAAGELLEASGPRCARARRSAPPRRAGGAAPASRRARRPPRRARPRGARAAGRCAPSSISARGPPSSTATTGSPLAWASSMTCPKVSVRLANRNTSALAYARASASPSSQPRKVACVAEPLAQRALLGPAAGEHEVQARVALAGREERVGQQRHALLLA